MNRQTFNLILVALLALTIIIVDAHNHHHSHHSHHNHHNHHNHHHHNHHNRHKTCMATETSSHTVTVTVTKALPTPTHESDHISCHVQNDRRRHNRHHHDYDNDHCTVTCTPTTTQYSTPTPTPACCETPGGPGFQNKFHNVDPGNVVIIPNIASDTDCCKACFAKPDCIQWAFPGQCITHENREGITDVCLNSLVLTENLFGSGIVRCSGDGDNCLA